MLVGGTSLYCPNVANESDPTPYKTSTIEYVMNTASGNVTGGGVSIINTIPQYQVGVPGTASQTYRNVPDVALVGDNNTGFIFYLNGTQITYGGCGLATQLFASFLLRCNFNYPITKYLYQIGTDPTQSSSCFHDITLGNNIPTASSVLLYNASAGYDNCTGFGSINGVNLFNQIKNLHN